MVVGGECAKKAICIHCHIVPSNGLSRATQRRELPSPLPVVESEINGCQIHLMKEAFCRFGFSGLSQGAHPDRLSLREKILQGLEVSV